jgi:hypothetical protein
MKPQWNDIDRKAKNSEKDLPQYHFAYDKSHMDLTQVQTSASAARGHSHDTALVSSCAGVFFQ